MTASDRTTDLLLMFSYVTLAMPYMYRAVDAGLRAIDVRTLTEAAQSLGASWGTILFRVILPNVQVAVLSGAFLTFAIVIGEFTMASLLDRPAFGPYLQLIGANRAYEPAALAIITFAITWACMAPDPGAGPPGPRQDRRGALRTRMGLLEIHGLQKKFALSTAVEHFELDVAAGRVRVLPRARAAAGRRRRSG